MEIGDHSVYAPALAKGGDVLDVGANHGRFSRDITRRFPVVSCAIEANPELVPKLKQQGLRVVGCAVGPQNGIVTLFVGTNDEASSTRLPTGEGAHLIVKTAIQVPMKTLFAALREFDLDQCACVKLDIEGSEIEVITSVGVHARELSPQWTIEFHDDAEFGLCGPTEVDTALRTMEEAGFSVMVRNWPSRSNVLFVDRRRLRISLLNWLVLKIRYQYCAALWRALLMWRA